MLPCASRDAGLQPDITKRIVMAAWMLHGRGLGRKQGRKPCDFPCKVAPASDERYLLCATGAAAVETERESVPPLCSATGGCSCVRDSIRFLNLWLQIAV